MTGTLNAKMRKMKELEMFFRISGETHTHLVRVFKGDLEVELAEDEELTLHHAVPQVPELLVTL